MKSQVIAVWLILCIFLIKIDPIYAAVGITHKREDFENSKLMQAYKGNYERHFCKKTDKGNDECLYQFKFSDASALVSLSLRNNGTVENQILMGLFGVPSVELDGFMLSFIHESSNGAIDIDRFAKEVFPAAIAKKNIVGGNTERVKLSGYYVEVTVCQFPDANMITVKISDASEEVKTGVGINTYSECKITGIIYDKNKPMVLIGNNLRGVNDSVCGGRISKISPTEIIITFPDNQERKYSIGDIIEGQFSK